MPITYKHNRTENELDSFVIQASDGYLDAQKRINITFKKKNDNFPYIINNKDLRLPVNESRVLIGPRDLSVRDDDIFPSPVLYKLKSSFQFGNLVVFQEELVCFHYTYSYIFVCYPGISGRGSGGGQETVALLPPPYKKVLQMKGI